MLAGGFACSDVAEPSADVVHSSVSEQILRLQRNENVDENTEKHADDLSTTVRAAVPADAPRAVGPLRDVQGVIISRGSQRAEVGCEVRSGDSVAYTDESGAFTLETVPSSGFVRFRMSCRGHIERQRVLIPDGSGMFRIEGPLIVGPRAVRNGDGAAAGANPRSVSIADAIRQMDEERADDDGATSVLRTAARGLANFAGTAAAVSTAGEEEQYRVLGHWKRAEEEAAAQAESDAVFEAIEQPAASPER